MGIGFGNQSGAQRGTSTRVDDGVFVDKGRIKAARIEYQTSRIESWKPDDVVLRLKLEVEGLDFDKDWATSGNYKKSGTPQGGRVVTGIGSAFKVASVFDELGIKGEISDTGEFPPQAIEALRGREVFILSYVAYQKDNGKPGYRDYDILAAQQEGETEEETRQRLYQHWLKQKEAGWVKDYRPELLEGQGSSDTSFNPSDWGSTGSSVEDAPW